MPRVTASKVEITATNSELMPPIFHLSVHTVVTMASLQSPMRILYQRIEKPSGFNDSISGVKLRNAPEVNDNGITTISGATRKNITKAQKPR